MKNTDSPIQSNSLPWRKLTFSLASLVCVLTICAVLLAWLVDHRRLVKQIGPPPQKFTQVYRLSNASAESAAQKLNEMWESDTIVAETVSNSVIVSAERKNLKRIDRLIRYVDRKDTGLVESRTQVSNLESESVPSRQAMPAKPIRALGGVKAQPIPALPTQTR